jgi:diguanylate cyclase (GGDEF)-like protein
VRVSLSLKIFILLVGSVVVTSVVLGSIFYRIERAEILDESSSRAQELANTVQSMLETAMLSSSSQAVGQIMNGFQALDEVVGITIFDAEGDPSFGTGRRVVDLEYVELGDDWVADGIELKSASGSVFRVLKAIDVQEACFRCHTETAPIAGMIQVDLDLQSEYELLATHRDRFILQSVVLGLILVGVLWLSFSRMVAYPLRIFAERARSVARGDFSQRVSLRRRDEIGDLAVSFNTMTQELETRLHEVEDARLRLETSIHRVGEALSSALDMSGIMRVLISESAAAGMFDAGMVLLRDGSLYVSERIDEMPWEASDGAAPLSERLEITLRALVDQAGQEAAVRQLVRSEAPGGEALPVPMPCETLALMPIGSEGEVLGHLMLVSEGRLELDESQRLTLEFLTTQAARAVALSRLHARTREMAITDGLTGLYDHRHFYERLELEMMRASRHDLPLSLVLLDVDDFKRYNDYVGHRGGDQALRRLGVILRETTRVTDISARYGGDEFVIILPHTEREEAVAFAERLRAKVEDEPFDGEEVQPGGRLTVSVGVACRPDDALAVDGIVEAADAALFKAKAIGRNRVVSFEPESEHEVRSTTSTGASLVGGLDRGTA